MDIKMAVVCVVQPENKLSTNCLSTISNAHWVSYGQLNTVFTFLCNMQCDVCSCL